jgi:hypothetical protein
MTCIATIHTATARAGLLQQHDTTRSGPTKPLPACLTRPVLTTSSPMLYHVHTHLTSVHRRYAAQPALPFLDARVAFSDDPLRTAAGFTIPLPSVGPAASVPHRIRCFSPPARDDHLWDCPTLFSPRRLFLSRSASRGRHASLACAAPTVVPYRPRRTHRYQPHHDRLQPDSSLTSRACVSVHPQPGVHDHRRAQRPPRPFLLAGVPLVASAFAATSSAPSHSKPASASAETRRAASASSAASAGLPIAFVAFVASPHAATFLVVS